MSSAPRPPACHRSRGRQGQALRVAAKSAAILDRHSIRWRSRTAVGAEEWLRRGQTKEWVRKQFSCQDFVITIREGRHQFSWHKKQEHSRIFPSDTVVVLIYALDSTTIDLCLSLFPWADFRSTKAAVKMHTLLDLRGPIPSFIHISDGKMGDAPALDLITPEAGAIYVMDRGYVDFQRLYVIH